MATKPKPRKRPESDSYTALIRDFPLKPIRNDDEQDRAIEIIAKLMGRKLDDGSSGYLDTSSFW